MYDCVYLAAYCVIKVNSVSVWLHVLIILMCILLGVWSMYVNMVSVYSYMVSSPKMVNSP